LNFKRKKCTLTTSTEMGDEFSLYDNAIQGRCQKLVKNRLIVHKWRANDWPEGHYGEVKFVLQELTQVRTFNIIFNVSGWKGEGLDHKDLSHSGWNSTEIFGNFSEILGQVLETLQRFKGTNFNGNNKS
jgi:hypothetical protein